MRSRATDAGRVEMTKAAADAVVNAYMTEEIEEAVLKSSGTAALATKK